MVQEEHRLQAKRLYRIFRDAPEVGCDAAYVQFMRR
jgi:hypothetical protein